MAEELCSMCEREPATTTYGLPVCRDCKTWLQAIDRHLRKQFPEPPERYIDRAREAIKARRAQAAAALARSSQYAATAPENGVVE